MTRKATGTVDEMANGDALADTSPAHPESGFGRLIRDALRSLGRHRNGDTSVRHSLTELIEEQGERVDPLDEDERTLVGNILKLRHRSVEDAMVPRADIVAVDSNASLPDVVGVMISSGHSRIPVYRETLDDAIGMVHIKDILAWRGEENGFELNKIIRRVLFVAPSMGVLELLLEMRASRVHMALVVDEFGGVDGLVTIEDVVEEIVGEIADEHERQSEPTVVLRPDGSFVADARTEIEVLDEHFPDVLSDDERAEIDTLGGLVVSLAGRVPIRGELIRHPSGIEFEVIEADPRRIKRVRARRVALAAASKSLEADAS